MEKQKGILKKERALGKTIYSQSSPNNTYNLE
jgi:hypothetical protein